MLHPRTVYIFEPNKLEVFLMLASQAELDRLDDEENYVIVDPETKQCYVNGSWVNIPVGKFQTDGQLVVVNAG